MNRSTKLGQLIILLAYANGEGFEHAVDALIPLVAREHRRKNSAAPIPVGYQVEPPTWFSVDEREAYRKVGAYNDAELRGYISSNSKIHYIKRLRELFAIGLKEAKYIADFRFDHQRSVFL